LLFSECLSLAQALEGKKLEFEALLGFRGAALLEGKHEGDVARSWNRGRFAWQCPLFRPGQTRSPIWKDWFPGFASLGEVEASGPSCGEMPRIFA